MSDNRRVAFRSLALPGGRRLLKNIAWNLVGAGGPLVAALLTVPILIRELGTDRFGVLTIAWALIGYFGLFDLGLGRALTKLVSERLGSGRHDDVPPLAWTALSLLLALGALAGGLLACASPWLGVSVLKIPLALQSESVHTLFVLAATVPLVFLTVGMRAFLEAYHRFDVVNLIRVPLGIWTFVGPLLVLQFSNRLDHVVWALAVGRLIALAAHCLACARVESGIFAAIRFRRHLIRPLVSFGGWLTVSNVVGPIMVYFDRFVIGAILGMSAVAYYTTPYEVIAKLGVLPDALVGVLFPVFAASIATDGRGAAKVFDQGLRGLLLVAFPASFILATFAHDGLALWLGAEFADRSYRVAQWLCAGMLLNSFARVAFAITSASGRPDLTAKLHLAELPLYVGFLWALIHQLGIVGAAAAWAIRAGVDMVILFFLASKLVPSVGLAAGRGVLRAVVGLGLIGIATMLPGLLLRVGFLAAVLAAFAVYAWTRVVTKDERSGMMDWLSPARGNRP